MPHNFRVNSRLLKEAKEIYSRYGLSVNDAITLFLLHSVYGHCIPFELLGDSKEAVRQLAWQGLYHDINEALQSEPLLRDTEKFSSLFQLLQEEAL